MSVFSSSELSQQHIYKEEDAVMDQQLCSQERNCCVDQEELEPLQMKDEPEPPQYKNVPDDLEHQWIKEEQEEPEPPQIKEEQETLQFKEKPEPPQIKEEQEPPQIKEVTDAVDPSQIKVKQEELCISQDLETMAVMQETDTIRVLQCWSQLDGGPGGSENSTVECKEAVNRQHRQLGESWKPILKLHRIGSAQKRLHREQTPRTPLQHTEFERDLLHMLKERNCSAATPPPPPPASEMEKFLMSLVGPLERLPDRLRERAMFKIYAIIYELSTGDRVDVSEQGE